MLRLMFALLLVWTTPVFAAKLSVTKVGEIIAARKNIPTPTFRTLKVPEVAEPKEEEIEIPKVVVLPEPDHVVSTRLSRCKLALGTIAEFENAKQPDGKDKACRIPTPVVLLATKEPFPVKFTKGLLLDCDFALKTARFLRDTVQPLANHHIGSPVQKLNSGQGYVCRRRNNAKTGKLSEHAFGNAMDWTKFDFVTGDPVKIQKGNMNRNEAAFLSAVRTAACGAFTTVLGPGSNAAHAEHFHFDLARSEKKNPYRICE